MFTPPDVPASLLPPEMVIVTQPTPQPGEQGEGSSQQQQVTGQGHTHRHTDSRESRARAAASSSRSQVRVIYTGIQTAERAGRGQQPAAAGHRSGTYTQAYKQPGERGEGSSQQQQVTGQGHTHRHTDSRESRARAAASSSRSHVTQTYEYRQPGHRSETHLDSLDTYVTGIGIHICTSAGTERLVTGYSSLTQTRRKNCISTASALKSGLSVTDVDGAGRLRCWGG